MPPPPPNKTAVAIKRVASASDGDPFAILRLRSSPPPGAAAIRARYRRLAKLVHPDKNAGDPVCERAFEILKQACEKALRSSSAAPTTTTTKADALATMRACREMTMPRPGARLWAGLSPSLRTRHRYCPPLKMRRTADSRRIPSAPSPPRPPPPPASPRYPSPALEAALRKHFRAPAQKEQTTERVRAF